MELPKNVVQIGKPDRTHKLFVEDYVVSYMKQLNRECSGKPIGLALYGKYVEENDCRYYFLYGAARVDGIEHRGPYLSQVEQEEIADIGRKYFGEYHFLAWCGLNGEPVEGFYVHTQGKGVFVEGYACFYEKNESMLNFMLQTEQKSRPEKKPENNAVQMPVARGEWNVEDVKKNVVPSVQPNVMRKTEYMKIAVAAVFLVLCVIGIATLNDYEKLEDLQVAARQIIASMTEQKLPDVSGGEAGFGTDDVSSGNVVSTGDAMPEMSVVEEIPLAIEPPAEEIPLMIEPPAEEIPAMADVPTAYTIKTGDTLISICTREYGSTDRLAEVCELNGIINADNIQIGQTILLP